MIPVKDHFTPNPVCVNPDDSVAKARSVIRKHGFRALPVIDPETRKLVGIISRGDILKVTSTRSNLQVKGLMNSNVIMVSQGEDMLRVARMMVKHGVRQVPVTDNASNLIGILSALDVLDAFIKNKTKPVKKKIRQVMSVNVVYCEPEENITKVWEKMLSTGFSGLPVLEKKKVVGMVSRMDLIKHGSARPHKEGGKNRQIPVKKIMQSKVLSADADDEIGRIAVLMSTNRIIRVPVVGERMKLLGIVDIEDVLRAYV